MHLPVRIKLSVMMFLQFAICYMPTLGLANAISFHQMRDPGRISPASA